MKRFCAVVCMLVIAGSALLRAQEPQAGFDPRTPAGVTRVKLTTAVELELETVRKFVDLDDQAVAELKIGLQPVIDSEAREFSQRYGRMQRRLGLSLTPRLRKAVSAAVTRLVQDKHTLNAYQTDVELRQKFERDVAVLGFVCAVDRSVRLSTSQVAKVEEVAASLFDKSEFLATDAVRMVGGNRKHGEQQLKQVLTPAQFSIWQTKGREPTQVVTASGAGGPDRAQRKKALVKKLTAVAVTRAAFLKDECKLADKQVKQLQLAVKGAVIKVVELRLDAEDKLRQQVPGDLRDQDAMQLARMEPATLLESRSRWNSLVNRVLNKDQKKLYEAAQTARNRRASEFTSTSLILNLGLRAMPGGGRVNLTGQQQVATRNLFSEVIKADASMQFSPPGPYRDLLTLPREKFVKAMGRENWVAFKPLLDQLRARNSEKADGESDR